METPTFQEVYEEFLRRLKDEEVATSCARRFIYYNEDHSEDGQWTVKIGKKRRLMVDWKSAVTTFVRNMPKYSKDLHIKLQFKRLNAD